MNSFWNGKRRYGRFAAVPGWRIRGAGSAAGHSRSSSWLAKIFRRGTIFPSRIFALPTRSWPRRLYGSCCCCSSRTLRGGVPATVAKSRPRGFYNMFEALYEGLMGFIGGIAGGAHFRLIFNMFMTIFLIVLLSNWMSLIPGVDTVGFIHPHVKEKFDADTGEYKVITTDGFEIYQGFLASPMSTDNAIGSARPMKRRRIERRWRRLMLPGWRLNRSRLRVKPTLAIRRRTMTMPRKPAATIARRSLNLLPRQRLMTKSWRRVPQKSKRAPTAAVIPAWHPPPGRMAIAATRMPRKNPFHCTQTPPAKMRSACLGWSCRWCASPRPI